MSNKRTRRQATVEPTNPLPTTEFGEIILDDNTLELSKVPTTEVSVDSLKSSAETVVGEETVEGDEASAETNLESTESTSEETKEADKDELNILVAGAPLQIAAAGAVTIEPAGVTKAAEFEGTKTALRVTTEQNALINRLQSHEVRLADYDENEPVDPMLEVLTSRIEKHFAYILGTSGFRDEKQKVEQLVTFASQLVRLTQLEPNVFFKVMDFIMSTMRKHGDKITPTSMFRFNIVTAKNHSAVMTRHNDFLNVCYKFAHNYADRNKLVNQIDFNKVCAGRTVKEAELLKSYFRKLANS